MCGRQRRNRLNCRVAGLSTLSHSKPNTVTGKSAMALRLILTCAAVASSTEPVLDGPIQVFIVAGEPALL